MEIEDVTHEGEGETFESCGSKTLDDSTCHKVTIIGSTCKADYCSDDSHDACKEELRAFSIFLSEDRYDRTANDQKQEAIGD